MSMTRVLGFAAFLAMLGGVAWMTLGREAPQMDQQAEPASAAPTSAPAATTASVPPTPAAPPVAVRPGSRLPEPEAAEKVAEVQAATLAERVRAGGEDSARALVTALSLAGFPLRQADGSVIAPAGPSQGILFEAWEVNALISLAGRRTMVAAPLSDVGGAIASTLPGVAPEAMTQAILDGVRQHARPQETNASLIFWSAFITELGRSARTHPQYDLLGEIDPASTQIDAIQIAMIGKRLAGDLLALANPDKAGAPPQQGWVAPWTRWLVTPVHAQATPCGFKEPETEIMDWAALITTTAFGEIAGMLEGQGSVTAGKVGTLSAAVGVILTYVKLAMTQGAFKIEFELENSPLVRTTRMRPQAGEKGTLVATVSLNFEDKEWVNCFRMMLNAFGLDLSVDNSGPLKDASVSWNGYEGFRAPWAIRAGPEHLVRFVGDENNRIQSGATTRQHSITNQSTDASGKARVDIEGIGQEEALGSQPRPVMKEATAAAMVVLKPADLYTDLKDATGTALGGLAGALTIPAELLYRTRWTFGGNYTFPVKDWKLGNGWSGAITYRRIERRFRENKRTSICCGGRTIRLEDSAESEETIEGYWEIPENTGSEALTSQFSMGTADVTINAQLTRREWSFNTGWASCRGGSHPQTSRSHEHLTKGTLSASGKTEVSVNLDDDGSYLVSAGSPSEPVGELQLSSREERDDGCSGAEPTKISNQTGKYRIGSHSVHPKGRIEPDANEITGSLTRVDKHAGAGIITTHIYQWQLYR